MSLTGEVDRLSGEADTLVYAAAPPAIPSGRPGFQPSIQQVTEAHKLTKYALSSLSFEDVPTACQNLHKALELLTGAGPAIKP